MAVFGRLVGSTPTLVGVSARTSRGWLRGTVDTAARVGRAVGQAAVTAPAAVVREATALLEPRPTRRVWSADGRAQVQVWGLAGPGAAALVTGVQDALEALDGCAGPGWMR